MKNGSIEFYQSEDGQLQLDVKMEDENVWLSQDQMVKLFGRTKSTIARHINNIFEEGELDKEATVANFATVALEGNKYS